MNQKDLHKPIPKETRTKTALLHKPAPGATPKVMQVTTQKKPIPISKAGNVPRASIPTSRIIIISHIARLCFRKKKGTAAYRMKHGKGDRLEIADKPNDVEVIDHTDETDDAAQEDNLGMLNELLGDMDLVMEGIAASGVAKGILLAGRGGGRQKCQKMSKIVN